MPWPESGSQTTSETAINAPRKALSTAYSTIQNTVSGIALAQPSRPHTLRAEFPKHWCVSCNGIGDPSPNSEAGRVCSGEVKLPNWVWRQVLCVGIQESIEP